MADTVTFSLTKPAILAFPDTLFTPQAVGKKGHQDTDPSKKKYGATVALAADSQDLATAKKLAAEVARAKWPGRPLAELKFPFENGDKAADKRNAEQAKAGKKADGDWQRGKVLIKARSKFEPQLSVLENGRIIDLEDSARLAAKSKFYFGVEALAELAFNAYEGVGANPDGVNCYLQKVCSLNKGTRLAGSGTSSADAFKSYTGHYTAENPAADDEIPF